MGDSVESLAETESKALLVEGQNQLPHPAGHATLDAAQDWLPEPEHTAGSCPAFHLQVPSSPSPQGCSQSILSLYLFLGLP